MKSSPPHEPPPEKLEKSLLGLLSRPSHPDGSPHSNRGQREIEIVAGQRARIVDPAQNIVPAGIPFPDCRLGRDLETLDQRIQIGKVPEDDKRDGHKSGQCQMNQRRLSVRRIDQSVSKGQKQKQHEGPLGETSCSTAQAKGQRPGPAPEGVALHQQVPGGGHPAAQRKIQQRDTARPHNQRKKEWEQTRRDCRGGFHEKARQTIAAKGKQEHSQQVGEQRQKLSAREKPQNHRFLQVVKRRVIG